jgi:hypothetical protein
MQDHIHVVDPEGGFCSECGDENPGYEVEGVLLEANFNDDRFTALEASLKRIEGALALLAAEALTNVPMPEDPTGE